MDDVSRLAKEGILLFQCIFQHLNLTPVVHFELEGGYQPLKVGAEIKHNAADLARINRRLAMLGINGELKPEYWRNQWEYVSLFNGQDPLTEAYDLARTMRLLPRLFFEQGIQAVYIKPVLWAGDTARLAKGNHTIFADGMQLVHIPNAVQVNVSVNDQFGRNLVPQAEFGARLQHEFLQSSLDCCLLYLPEEEAFERLALKQNYQLDAELSSPEDISGGHQGSVALYKEHGKHNQLMGETPLIVGLDQKALISQVDWYATARIEHRLGAASMRYNPYLNVLFALGNVFNTVSHYLNPNGLFELSHCHTAAPFFSAQQLPKSLHNSAQGLGAITLFEQQTWLSDTLAAAYSYALKHDITSGWQLEDSVRLKTAVLNQYHPQPVLLT
ncbi:hypothetical protein PULV_b0296 [Pseudoalteromonas ulvae UL12]|uniref:hypothetical protein n=1 Tax=Pseudoalteromonas ulvae TaxID=107327 RepID=UPI00186B5AEE|nr:hypothetical protein [Pseudoalteromonas ulvae]MBE0365668.1 hypothetical protein [Pseudoalteromonas ulvae UL12]